MRTCGFKSHRRHKVRVRISFMLLTNIIKLITMKTLPFLFTFALGFGLCLWLTTKGCFHTKETQFINTVEYRFKDTILFEKVSVYIPITKIKTEIDSAILEKFVEIYKVDTTFIDTSYNMVINQYQDSTETENYKLKWKAETLGYLTNFENEVIITKDSTVQTITKIIKPKFCAQVGISNLLESKIGVGYKGWMLEANFEPVNKFKFKQLFITKQFAF